MYTGGKDRLASDKGHDDMNDRFIERFARPRGGMPGQAGPISGHSVLTDCYMYMPGNVMRDIVASKLPGWINTRLWVLARPMSGFTTTFSQYVVEVEADGGTSTSENNGGTEAVLFVTHGHAEIEIGGSGTFALKPGSYAYLGPDSRWALGNSDRDKFVFHWIRKTYQPVPGIDAPSSFVTHVDDIAADHMHPDSNVWTTKRFVCPDDMSHDMHVNIVSFQPGARIPFMETHVMEHGMYMLTGKGLYKVNQDWLEVEAGDFLCLRAFCPQACYAVGQGEFSYLLYKDVNRHAALEQSTDWQG